jgi:hypothetical protein
LAEITILGGIRSLSGFNNNKITSVIIPEVIPSDPPTPARDVITIGTNAFANNKLTNVTISNSVTSIGASAFAYNELTTVTIPDSVTAIGESAFRNNELTEVTIGNKVSIIGSYAFINNQLTSITIGESVRLDSTAFGNGFERAYNATSGEPGTYTRVDTTSNDWEKEVDSD